MDLLQNVIIKEETVHYTEKYKSIISKLYDNVLTKKIFYDHVMADDGIIYEKTALLKYMRDNDNKSPTYPFIKLSKNFMKSNIITSLIDLFIKHNPELAKDVYEVTEDIDYLDYDRLNVILRDRNRYPELRKYKKIELDQVNYNSLVTLFESKDMDSQKYFIDNVVDLNCVVQIDGRQQSLIHMSISANNYYVAEYLADKVDVNFISTVSGDTPLHALINKNARCNNLISHILSHGVDVSIKNTRGTSVLSYIMRYCDAEIIECVLYHCTNSDMEEKSRNIELLYENSSIEDNEKENFVCQLFN